MKKALLAFGGLGVITAAAEGTVFLRIHVGGLPFSQVHPDPWPLAAALGSLAMLIGVLAALAAPDFVGELRRWASGSLRAALGAPFLLLIPYFVFAFGTATFSLRGAAKLAAYIAVPTALLLPDRLREAGKVGWRDFAAMLALAFPVGAHWLRGIWLWPEDLYFFRPLVCVCVGGYVFMILRRLEGVGYRLVPRAQDLLHGLVNFAAVSALAIPLGLYLGFIHPHAHRVSVGGFAFQFFGIYLTIAVPEELLFRGILQNFLVHSMAGNRRVLYGMLIASVVFGAAHLHHPPVPNWRYGILATLAGIFYGNAFRARQHLPASAFTHTLVDTTWHFWF